MPRLNWRGSLRAASGRWHEAQERLLFLEKAVSWKSMRPRAMRSIKRGLSLGRAGRGKVPGSSNL